MPPLSLSDQQLDQVWGAARPLAPQDRSKFLEAVAKELRGNVEPGDGDVYRAIKEAQRKFFDPPIMHAGPQLLPKDRREARSLLNKADGEKVQA